MTAAQIIITIITAVFASGGFWAFLTSRMQARDSRKEDTDMMKAALLGLLHDSLMAECENYIDRGSITVKEYEELNRYKYKPYKALGGNGTAETLMESVKDLLTAGNERRNYDESRV